ncbi:MAG: DUF3566 domain-containing protein [Aeriscardovia sp.]|nr:DUF3566 domain-containing protein [Aeriscardovia sp.]
MAEQNKSAGTADNNVHVSGNVKPLDIKSTNTTASAPAAKVAASQDSKENAKKKAAKMPPSIQRPGRNKIRVPKARRMKLSVTKVDPWSVAKVSFLLSIAWGIIQVVCTCVIYWVLQAAGFFNAINSLVSSTGVSTGGTSAINIQNFLNLGTIVSFVTVFAIFQVLLIVIVATIGSFIYNVVCMLVGGVRVTLGDD